MKIEFLLPARFELTDAISYYNKQSEGLGYEFAAEVKRTLERIEYLDLSKARRPIQEQRRVNVDFPLWMIHQLDKEAKRLGVPRQSIIKLWVAERLEKAS